MFWIGLVLAASALLAWLLVALRRYEHESASAALLEVRSVREELEALRLRVQALEAIAAEDAAGKVPLDNEDSVSSPKHTRVRS